MDKLSLKEHADEQWGASAHMSLDVPQVFYIHEV